MSGIHFSNVIGFDDAPFSKHHAGLVKVVGTVFARLRLNGVLVGEVDEVDAHDEVFSIASAASKS